MKIHLFLLFTQAAILHLSGGDGRNWSNSEFEKDSKDSSVATQEFIPYDLNYRMKVFQGSQSKRDGHKPMKRSFFKNSASAHTESADSSQESNKRHYYNTMNSLRSTRKRNNKDKQIVNGRNSTEKDVSRKEQNTKNYKRPMKMMSLNKNDWSNVHNKKTDTLQMYRQLLLKTGQMEKFRTLGKVKQRQLIQHLMLKNRKMAKFKNEQNHAYQINRVPEQTQVAETSHVTGLSRAPEKVTTESSNRYLNTPTSRNTTLLNTWSDGKYNEKHVPLKNDPSHRNTSPLKPYKKDYKYSMEENQRSQKYKKEQVVQQKLVKGKNKQPFLAMTSPNMIDSGTHQPNAFMFNHNGDIVHYRGSSYQTIYPEFEHQKSFGFKTNMQYLRDIPVTSQPDIKTKKEDENSSEIKIDEDNEKRQKDEKLDKKDDIDNEIMMSSAEDKDNYDSPHQTQTRLPSTFTIRTKNYNDMKPNFRTPRYDFTQQFNLRQKQRRLIQRRKLHLPSTKLPLKTFRNQFRVNRRPNRYGMLRKTPPWSNFRANIGQPSQFVMISSDHRKDMPAPRTEDQDSSEDTSESDQSQFSPSYYHSLNPGLNSMDIAGGFQYNYHPYTGNDQLDQGKVDYYQQYPNIHVDDNNEDSSDENTSTEQEQGDETDYQEPPSYVDMHGSDVALDTGRVNEVNHFYGESTIVPLGQLKQDQDDDDQDDNINSSENAVEETSEEQDNQKRLPENIHKNHDSPDTLLIVLDNDSKTKKNVDNEEQKQLKQSSSEDFVEGKKASPIMKADHSYSNGILVILDNDGEKPVSTIKPTPAVEQSEKFPEDKHKQFVKAVNMNTNKDSSFQQMSNKSSYAPLNDTPRKNSYAPLNETNKKHLLAPSNITKNNEITKNTRNNSTKTSISINDISFSLNSSDKLHRPSFSVNSSNQLYRTSFKPLQQLSEKKSSLNNLLIELGTKENIFNIRASSRGISKHVEDYHRGISESKTLRKDQRFRLNNKSRPATNRYKSNARKMKNKFRYKNIGHPFKKARRTGNNNIPRRKRFRKLYPNIHFQADTELFGNRVREVVEIPDIDWTLNGSNLERDNIKSLKKSKSAENKSDDFPRDNFLERFPPNHNAIRGIHSNLHTIKTDPLDSQKSDSQSIEDDNKYRKIPLEYPKSVDDYRQDPLHGIPNVFTVVSSVKDDDDDDSGEHSQSNHNLVINTIKYKPPNIDRQYVDSLNPVYLNTLKDIRSFVDKQNEDKDDFNEGADEEREVQENMEYTNKQPAFHSLLARGRDDSYKTVSRIQLNHEKMSPVYGEISGSQEEFPDIESDHIIDDYHYPKFDKLKTKIQLPTGIYQEDKLYGIDSDDENEELPVMYKDIMYKKHFSKHDNNRIPHDNEDTHSTSDIVNTIKRNNPNNLNNLYVLGNAEVKPNKSNIPLMSHNSISALYGQSPLNHDDTFDSVEDSQLDSNSMADELNYPNKKWKLSSHSLHNKILVTAADSHNLLGSTESKRTLNENRLKNAMKKKTSSLFKSHLRNRDKMTDDASLRSLEGVRSGQEFYRTTYGRKGQIFGEGRREENQEIYLPRDSHSSEMLWRKNRNWKSSLHGLETQNIPRQYWRIYKLLKEGNLPEKYKRLYYHLKDEMDKIVNKSSHSDIHKIHKTYVHENFSDPNKAFNKFNIKVMNRSSSSPLWDDKNEVELLNRNEHKKKTDKEVIDIDLVRQKNKGKPNVIDVHDDTQVALEGVYLKNSLDIDNNGLETPEIGGRLLEDENISGDFGNNTFEQNSKNWRDTSFDIAISNPRWNDTLAYEESGLEKNVSLNDKDYNTNKISYQKLHQSFSNYDLAGQGSENSYPLVNEQLGKTQFKNYFDENIPRLYEGGIDFSVQQEVNNDHQKHNININSQGRNGKDLDPTNQGSVQYPTENGHPLNDIIENHQYENVYNYHGSVYDPYDYLGEVDISHMDPVENAFQVPYNSAPDGVLVKFDNQRNHLDSSGLTNRKLPKHKLMKDNSDLLTQYNDEMNLNDPLSPRKHPLSEGKDTEKVKIKSKHTHIDKPRLFGSDFQEKSDSVVLDKYLSHDIFQKVYESQGEGKLSQDSHGGKKHTRDNLREKIELQGINGEKKHLRSNLWKGKQSQDSLGDKNPSHDSLWEGKHSKHSHREAKLFQDSHGDTKLLQSQRDINDDEDDSKTQEIDIAKPNDNELVEDVDDGDVKHYSSGSSYYSDFIGQPLGVTEKDLPNKFQVSPSNILSTSATIIYQNKTTVENKTDAKKIDLKETDHNIFSVTPKKIFNSFQPSLVTNIKDIVRKWSYPSKGNMIQNVSFTETKERLVDTDVPLTSTHSPQFLNISKTSKDIDIKGMESQLKEIDNTTEEIETEPNQSSFFYGISLEPSYSDLDNTSVKISKDSTHQRLLTFGKEDQQVSKGSLANLEGIPIIDFNSSQTYKEPTFLGEMLQTDDANATEIPKLTSANAFLIYDENSYNLLPEETWRDKKNSTETIEKMHDDRINSSVYIEGTIGKWGLGGHTVKPTISQADDRNIDILKKDTEKDLIISQASYVDEGEHLLGEIELGESLPQLEDKKIHLTPEDEYSEYQHHLGASPINRGIHQLHQILPDILVEEPDISHKPTIPQSTTALKSTEKHVNISETLKEETAPTSDTNRQMFFKGTDIDKERKRITGRTEVSELDFLEGDSFLKPKTLLIETTEGTQTVAKNLSFTYITEHEVSGKRTDQNILKTTEDKIPPTNLSFKTKEDPLDSHKKTSHGVGFKIPTVGINTRFITHEQPALPTISARFQEKQSTFLHTSTDSVSEIGTGMFDHSTSEQGQKSLKESSYTRSASDIEAEPDFSTLEGEHQTKKGVNKFNRTSEYSLKDQLDIAKSDTTLLGIKELRRYGPTKPDSTLQGNDKLQSKDHKYIDGILQSTDKSRSHLLTINVDHLHSGEPPKTRVTFKSSDKIKGYNTPELQVTSSGKHKLMRSKSTTLDGTTHDINISRSPKTIELNGSIYSSDKLHSYKSTQTHSSFYENIKVKKPTQEVNPSYKTEESRKSEPTWVDGILQKKEEKKLYTASHQDGVSFGEDVSRTYEKPTQPDRILSDIEEMYEHKPSQLDEVSDGRGDSVGHTLIHLSHTKDDIEELRQQQATQLPSTLYGREIHRYSTVQLNGTTNELSRVNGTPFSPEEALFYQETKLHNISHGIDEARGHKIIEFQSISYDREESGKNESTHVYNISHGTNESKEHKQIQSDSTMHGTDKSHSLDPTELDGILHSTDQSHRHKVTQQDSTLFGTDILDSLEPTQLDGTSYSTSASHGHKVTKLEGTDMSHRLEPIHLDGISHRHKVTQQESTLFGTDKSHSLEPTQLDGTVHSTSEFQQESTLFGTDKSHSLEPTQLDGTVHSTGEFQQESTLFGTDKSHSLEPTQLDGTVHSTSEFQQESTLFGTDKSHSLEPTQLDGTVHSTGEFQQESTLFGTDKSHSLEPTQLDGTVHSTGEFQQESTLFGTNKSHSLEPTQLDGTVHSTGEFQQESTLFGTDKSHSLEPTQLDGTVHSTSEFQQESTLFGTDKSHSLEPTQLDGTVHSTGEFQQESTLFGTDKSHSLEPTQLDGTVHSTGEFQQESTLFGTNKSHSLEPTQLDGTVHSTGEFQQESTLFGTNKSHSLEPTQLDGTVHSTGEFQQESTLFGTDKSHSLEPTQFNDAFNIGTGKLDDYKITHSDGTLYGTSELHGHKLIQLHSTSHGTGTSHGQEQLQLEGTLNVDAGKLNPFESTQLNGVLHGTSGRLASYKPSLLDSISHGFKMSHGQELVQTDGISSVISEPNRHKLPELDGIGKLHRHKLTETDDALHGISGLHGHAPTQTDQSSHVTSALHKQEPSHLKGISHGMGKSIMHGPHYSEIFSSGSIFGLHVHEPSQLAGIVHDTDEHDKHGPTYLDRTSQSIDGIHGHKSSPGDRISYSTEELKSHKLSQTNGSLYDISETRTDAGLQQHNTSHSLEEPNIYKTTQLHGGWHGKSDVKSDETVKSDVDLHIINDTSLHGETAKTDGSVKLTSYQIPELTGVSHSPTIQRSYEPVKQHSILDIKERKSSRSYTSDSHLQETDHFRSQERTVTGDISHVTDKSKSHKPSKFDPMLNSTGKSRIYQSTKQDISLSDIDRLEGSWHKNEKLETVQPPKTDIMYHRTEGAKRYEPVKTDSMLHGSTKLDGASQDTDTLRSYDPLELDAISHSSSKVGDYLPRKTDETSDGTIKSISYGPTKVHSTSHDADKLESSQIIQFDDTSHHTSNYTDRMMSYDPTNVIDTFQVSDKSTISETTKIVSPVAETTLEKHKLSTYSKSSNRTGHDTLHPSQQITIKSNGRSWIKVPTLLAKGFSKVTQTLPQDTDHQTNDDSLYQTSFTDKHHDIDEIKIAATARIKEEKEVAYNDLDRKVSGGIPTFVTFTLEPPNDGKILLLEGKTQTKTGLNDVDSHKLPVDISDMKTKTFTNVTLLNTALKSLDGLVNKTRKIELHSALKLTHVYPTMIPRLPDEKQKIDLTINASSKPIDDLSSIISTANITKEKLSTKSEDFPKKNKMGRLSSLEPKLSSTRRISATRQRFSGMSSILDKNTDQKHLKTLLDLPSTLLFGQLMDVGLTSKVSHRESHDPHSSIETGVDHTKHFPGFDTLRQLTRSVPKEKKKFATGIVSDLFRTKHQGMTHFIEKKTPTVKTPAIKLEEQNINMTKFTKYLDHKPVSLQHSEFDTEPDIIPIQQSVTMTPQRKDEDSVTDIDHKSQQRDQSKFLKTTQIDSTKVQHSPETDLTDENIPLPEYTSFVNYQDSIDHRASTSGVPLHMLTTFNSNFTKTDQKEKLFPKTLQSNIPFYNTPVLDFTEDDRKTNIGGTTQDTHSVISGSSKKQQFHTKFFTNQYKKTTESERPYATTGYPSMIEHFDRTDLMKFHIPGDSTINTYSGSTLFQTTPKMSQEQTTWVSKGTFGITGSMKSLKLQPERQLLQTVPPSTHRNDIKNIWEDNSSLMLNLYETSKFTKASFHRKKESVYYMVKSVDDVATSLKLNSLGKETCKCYFSKQTIEISCKQEMRGDIIKLAVPRKTRNENIQCRVTTYNDSSKGYESCLEGRKYCDHMFGTRFRKCMLQLGRENLLKYYTMCNTVMCREAGDMHQWKNDACDVIDTLAHECEIIGIKVSWREVTKCYKNCPENMTFKHNASICRITCDNYNREIKCPTDETESRCDCRDGYVLSKETCVPIQECGCIYQGYFLEVGQTMTLFGCNMMAVCVRDKFGWSSIEYHELPGCSPRESCHLVNESYECIVHCGGEVCHENATCEENKCRCHVGLYGDGVTTCRSTLGVCSCLVSGLSRYRTYDGQMIHYLTTCPLELTTVNQNANTRLSVYSTTLFSSELMLSFGTRRYRTANVTINGLNIYMDTSGKTYVNDVKIALPFRDNQVNVSISYTAGWITICSEDGVSVSYDSKHRIKMFLPKEYRSKPTGICGNCNGIHDELKNSHGKFATTSEIVGRSYSLNTSHSCGPVTIKKCERGVKRCELMRSGMFADCHPYLDDGLVQSYYDSCMHMTCAFKPYTDYMDKLTCAALESLDTECMSRGYIVEWRSQRLCPVSCCRPMLYNQHVNETEESCVPSLETCPIKPVDGCTCAEGYVLDNNKCVLPRDCGCWYNNSLYIQLGESIHLPGCNTMVQCRKVATGKRNLVITNLPDGCGNNSLCILKGHKYQCVCEEGFARNKNDTFCLKIPECGDQPVDVVFVVDVSGSINVTGLNSTKHFLTHFINSTNIGMKNMQISILLFNDKPHSLFQLNRYTEKKQMLDAVDKIGPPEGTTYLGRALVFVALVSLQKKMGAREHVNRAVVILTDGVLHDAERAERWGALLRRQKKAELFAIGVGEADPAQLQRLTRNRNNVFYVREYVQLNGIMDILLQSVCM